MNSNGNGNGNSKNASYDYLIIGAGPAGLQLGYHLASANRNYVILEAGETPGTFFKTYPRHRTLISINKVYTGYDDREVNMRWDWNSLLSDSDEMLLKNYTTKYFPAADTLVKYLCDYAEHFNLNTITNARVVHVTKDNDVFKVTDQQGRTFSAKRIIAATGVSKPYLPPIPGIEHVESYVDVSVNPDDFKNQRVLILGKGNSAFETADNLIETAAVIHVASPNPLNLAWKTHFVGHLRAINNNFLDTYQLKLQNAVLDATIEKIERDGDKYVVSVNYTHANGEKETLVYDRIIACTGFRFDASIFDETCRPEMTIKNRFPAQTSEWESVNVKDLYFAGTITQMRDFKRTTSGFIHGFRYNVQALHHILEKKYEGVEWPHRTFEATPQALMEAVIKRVNKSSGLWQQFGFICDLLVVSDDGREARYYDEMPVDYVHDSELGRAGQYYTITLEYGEHHIADDPFNVTRVERNNFKNADESNFLHPVVRRYSGSTLLTTHHIIEDLAAEWLEDVHTKPLLEFFKKEMSEVKELAMAATA